jgi:hypothetical protein
MMLFHSPRRVEVVPSKIGASAVLDWTAKADLFSEDFKSISIRLSPRRLGHTNSSTAKY